MISIGNGSCDDLQQKHDDQQHYILQTRSKQIKKLYCKTIVITASKYYVVVFVATVTRMRQRRLSCQMAQQPRMPMTMMDRPMRRRR